MSNRFLSWVAIVAAFAIAAPVGYVGYRQTRHNATLASHLAEVEQRSQRSIELLTRKLDEKRDEAERLRTSLRDSEAEAARIARELFEASQRVTVLETLADEPPALEIRISPADDLTRFVAWARNPGRRPVRIVATEGAVWLDGQPGAWGSSDALVTLSPDDDADFFEFSLLGSEPARVAQGRATFRGGLCLTYERSTSGSTSAWSTLHWFEYDPALGSVVLLDYQTLSLESDPATACDLENATPPWS